MSSCRWYFGLTASKEYYLGMCAVYSFGTAPWLEVEPDKFESGVADHSKEV